MSQGESLVIESVIESVSECQCVSETSVIESVSEC